MTPRPVICSLAVAALCATAAHTEPTNKEVAPKPQEMAQAVRDVQLSGLIGSAVYDEAGERIGTVDDVIVDDSGAVSSVIVGVGGFLGIGEKHVAVPLKTLVTMRDEQGNLKLVSQAPKDAVSSMPAFVKNSNPAPPAVPPPR